MINASPFVLALTFSHGQCRRDNGPGGMIHERGSVSIIEIEAYAEDPIQEGGVGGRHSGPESNDGAFFFASPLFHKIGKACISSVMLHVLPPTMTPSVSRICFLVASITSDGRVE